MTTCPLEMTSHELDEIKQCEAVVVREYESLVRGRWAVPVAWGDFDEMEAQAVTTGWFIVPPGVRIVGQRAVRVSELLP
jgi:hypothetical protein